VRFSGLRRDIHATTLLSQCKTDLSPQAGGEVLEIKLEHDAESDMVVYSYLMTHPLTLMRLVTDYTAGFFREQQQLILRKSEVTLADASAVARQNLEKKERALVEAGNEARSLSTEVAHLQKGLCNIDHLHLGTYIAKKDTKLFSMQR